MGRPARWPDEGGEWGGLISPVQGLGLVTHCRDQVGPPRSGAAGKGAGALTSWNRYAERASADQAGAAVALTIRQAGTCLGMRPAARLSCQDGGSDSLDRHGQGARGGSGAGWSAAPVGLDAAAGTPGRRWLPRPRCGCLTR